MTPNVKGNGKRSSKWSVEATKLLVSFYEMQPCLYDRLNPDYRNKKVRLKALNTITNQMQKCDKKMNYTMQDILAKINGIRTQFSVICNSKRRVSNTTGQDITPTWWLFDHLKFLMPHFRGVKNDSMVHIIQDNFNNGTENLQTNPAYIEDGTFINDTEHQIEPEQHVETKMEVVELIEDDDEQHHNNNRSHNNDDKSIKGGDEWVPPQPSSMEQCHTTELSNITPIISIQEPNNKVENPTSSYYDQKNDLDYLNISINHLKVELASINNSNTRRQLLRKMFQLVYNAQDQECSVTC